MFPLYMGVVPSETLKFRNIAAAMGIVVAIGELSAGGVAPIAAGWLADRTTLDTPLLIAAGMSVVGAVICLFIKETNPAVLRGGGELGMALGLGLIGGLFVGESWRTFRVVRASPSTAIVQASVASARKQTSPAIATK